MVTIESIIEADKMIEPYIFRTQLLSSPATDSIVGAEVVFKPESLQVTGSFKARGAFNSMLLLNEEQRKQGIIAYSSGNHGKALAYAGHMLGIPVSLVLSIHITDQKLKSIKGYGATVYTYDPLTEDRTVVADNIRQQQQLTLIPPYDHEDVIAGQGTTGYEFLSQTDGKVDEIYVPVAGGGLLAGIAVAVKAISSKVKIFGVEPETANDVQLSMMEGKIVHIEDAQIKTICEGLRTNEPGSITFPYIQSNVDAVVTASDDSVRQAMRLIWDELKLVVEPAAALTLAYLLESKEQVRGKQIGVVMCGGNISIEDYMASLNG